MSDYMRTPLFVPSAIAEADDMTQPETEEGQPGEEE